MAAVSMALVGSLLGAEVVLRVLGLGSPIDGNDVVQSWEPADIFQSDADPEIGFRLKQGYVGTQTYRGKLDGDVVLAPVTRVDADGFRLESTRTAGKLVLAVGDSTTFGVGVTDGQSWPGALERRLPTAFRVRNAGVPGRNLPQSQRWITTHAAAFSPAVVLLAFYLNDLLPAVDVAGDVSARTMPAPVWATREAGVRRWSRIVNLGWRSWERRRLARAVGGGTLEYIDEINRRARSEDIHRDFERFRRACHGMRAKGAIVLLPVLDVSDPRAADPILQLAAEVAGILDIPVIAAQHALDQMDIPDRIVLPAERHASAAGNEAIAAVIDREGARLKLW